MKISVLWWSAAWLSVSYTAAFQPSPLQKSTNNIQSTGTLQNEHKQFSSSLMRSERTPASKLFMSSAAPSDPQVLASGYSQQMKLQDAIQEAITMAIQEGLPLVSDGTSNKIDLAIVSVSSLYDGSASPSEVVPAVLGASKELGYEIENLVGSSSGGFVSSRPNPACLDRNENTDDEEEMIRSCLPIEQEGVPGVSVTLCVLPDVQVKSFHVLGDDVPDDYGRLDPEIWKRAVGLDGFEATPYMLTESEDGEDSKDVEDKDAAFFLLPSPAFQNDLDLLLQGLETNYPSSQIFGAIASTVSSLSRARLFRYQASDPNGIQTLADGCLGVALTGDLRIKTMVAQGAKPVGGVYQIVKGQESTIQAIALDETATQLVQEAEEQEEEEEEEEDEEEEVDEYALSPEARKAKMAAAYAKARIPKPILAEANFLMKTLSDDDQSYMRKALLVGLERGGSMGRTPSELARLAEGKGHQYTVHQVASAGMKDGSVTLSLGSVDIKPGTRLRFFVRESDFAKKEVAALWTGFKRRALGDNLAGKPAFNPTGCFLFPTLDRGSKFFLGKKPGYESENTLDFLPTVPSVSGFFANGVIGSLQSDSPQSEPASLYGSASGYVLFGSKSGRPIYSPADSAGVEEDETDIDDIPVDEDWKVTQIATDVEKKAPRDENGELIIKRREVHSGRSLTVSAVEWSVAEKSATPSSALEGFMWDKETEVDRFRERVPLANLVSQCKLYNVDPSKPKPRDWIGPIMEAAKGGKFVLVPECKRMEPISGSLRKRYDITKIVKDFTVAGAPAISVNCDPVLFGGSLEDVTVAREAASKAALEGASEDGVVVPPIMASDLLLYPYQLYKMRLAGADAVNMVAAALAAKDLLYLTKIAQALNMQALLSVTSAAQIQALNILPAGGIAGLVVSNRDLEDFSFDMTGQQALKLLQSEELAAFRAKHGGDSFPVFVEGRVGLIDAFGEPGAYLEALQEAGATGAIVGGGLAPDDAGKVPLKTFMEI